MMNWPFRIGDSKCMVILDPTCVSLGTAHALRTAKYVIKMLNTQYFDQLLISMTNIHRVSLKMTRT